MDENEKEELQRDWENYVLGILKRIHYIYNTTVKLGVLQSYEIS